VQEPHQLPFAIGNAGGLCAAVEQLQATVAAKPAVDGKAKTKARTAASA